MITSVSRRIKESRAQQGQSYEEIHPRIGRNVAEIAKQEGVLILLRTCICRSQRRFDLSPTQHKFPNLEVVSAASHVIVNIKVQECNLVLSYRYLTMPLF